MKKGLLLILAVVMVLGVAMSASADVKSKLEVTFYGYVKTDVVAQKGLGAGNSNYIVYALPDNLKMYAPLTGGTPDIENEDFNSFGINSLQSRFGFLIAGPEGNGMWSRGRIEADFYADWPMGSKGDPEPNKASLMLRRATVEFGNDAFAVLAGNEWMVVSPIFPHVNNYPYGADAGNLGYRVPQLRFTMFAMDKKIEGQLALDGTIGTYPNSAAYYDTDTGRASAKPTIEGGLLYKDGKTNVGITGHYGWETRTSRSGKYEDHEIETWSANVHGAIPLGEMVLVSGEWFTGANLDGWFTGGQGNGWVFRYDEDKPADLEEGDFEALNSTGGWGEIMLTPNESMQVIAGYGHDDIDNGQLDNGKSDLEGINGAGSTGVPTKNSMTWAAFNYFVTPAAMVSLEWIQIITQYEMAEVDNGLTKDWEDGQVDRWTVSFWFMY